MKFKMASKAAVTIMLALTVVLAIAAATMGDTLLRLFTRSVLLRPAMDLSTRTGRKKTK